MKPTDKYYFEFDPKLCCWVVKKRVLEALTDEQPNKTNKKSTTKKKQ